MPGSGVVNLFACGERVFEEAPDGAFVFDGGVEVFGGCTALDGLHPEYRDAVPGDSGSGFLCDGLDGTALAHEPALVKNVPPDVHAE